MNRGTTDSFADAAARAVDRQVARAAKCEDCGRLDGLGHYVGCAKLPKPTPAELCAECMRTPPYHAMTCPQGPLADALPARPVAAIGPDAADDVPASSAASANEPEEVLSATPPPSASSGQPRPQVPGDLPPVGVLMARLRAQAEAAEAAEPPPLPDVRLFPEDAEVDITRAQYVTLSMVDVGWHIARRSANDVNVRVVNLIVTGYSDDDEKGRTFTVLRWSDRKPWIQRIPATEVEPLDILPPNTGSSRDAYRQLAAYVAKRTGTADESEPRALATALVLAQTVI